MPGKSALRTRVKTEEQYFRTVELRPRAAVMPRALLSLCVWKGQGLCSFYACIPLVRDLHLIYSLIPYYMLLCSSLILYSKIVPIFILKYFVNIFFNHNKGWS